VGYNKYEVMFRGKNSVKCEYCKRYLSRENATFDHVVPQSKGGYHKQKNGALACKRSEKGASSCDCCTFHPRRNQGERKKLPVKTGPSRKDPVNGGEYRVLMDSAGAWLADVRYEHAEQIETALNASPGEAEQRTPRADAMDYIESDCGGTQPFKKYMDEDQVRQLEQALAEAQKDAARYRWLPVRICQGDELCLTEMPINRCVYIVRGSEMYSFVLPELPPPDPTAGTGAKSINRMLPDKEK
jgi:hypothetical protein